MKAILYRRVSTARQSTEGKSLRDQETELRAYCQAQGWRIIGNHEDAISGRTEKTESRVGLEAAIQQACETKGVLIVYDLDRLARSQAAGMHIIDRLRKCGAQLVIKSLGLDTTTPAGEMIVGILFAIAQWGSRQIGEGVKRANRNTVAEKGYRTQGKQPFGWGIVRGKKVRIAREQKLLRLVAKIRAQVGSDLGTAKKLNAKGVPTPMLFRHGERWQGSRQWNASSVRKLRLNLAAEAAEK